MMLYRDRIRFDVDHQTDAKCFENTDWYFRQPIRPVYDRVSIENHRLSRSVSRSHEAFDQQSLILV